MTEHLYTKRAQLGASSARELLILAGEHAVHALSLSQNNFRLRVI